MRRREREREIERERKREGEGAYVQLGAREFTNILTTLVTGSCLISWKAMIKGRRRGKGKKKVI